MNKNELKNKKRVAVTRRKHDALMRDLVKLNKCGHDDCRNQEAAARAVAAALSWAVDHGVPTDALPHVIADGLALTMFSNGIKPDDLATDRPAKSDCGAN